jgi:ABC-type protease/lipase transport system fused ATPase/permease subunit
VSSARAVRASRRWSARWSCSDAARGRVRADGAALDQWSSDVLGRHTGCLPQDVELFAGHCGEHLPSIPRRSRRRSSPPPRKPA